MRDRRKEEEDPKYILHYHLIANVTFLTDITLFTVDCMLTFVHVPKEGEEGKTSPDVPCAHDSPSVSDLHQLSNLPNLFPLDSDIDGGNFGTLLDCKHVTLF